MRRALFFLFLLSWPLLAQEKPPAPKKPAESGVQIRFVAQATPKGLGEVIMVTEEARSEPFKLPTNNLSRRQKAPARQFLLQPVGGKVVLSKISLPEKGRDFIALLVIGKGKKGFTPVILPAKDPGFKPGDVFVKNVSTKMVMGSIGTTKFVVPPSKDSVIRPKGAEEEGRFYNVMIGVREGGQNKVLSTSRWPVDDRVRSYVFFFDDPKTKSVDFRAIDEFVPIEKATSR